MEIIAILCFSRRYVVNSVGQRDIFTVLCANKYSHVLLDRIVIRRKNQAAVS